MPHHSTLPSSLAPRRMACEPTIVIVPIERILPTRVIATTMKRTSKYRCIAASIRELGLIEPLFVYPQAKTSNPYMLLGGHTVASVCQHWGLSSRTLLSRWEQEGVRQSGAMAVGLLAQVSTRYWSAIRQSMLAIPLTLRRSKSNAIVDAQPQAAVRRESSEPNEESTGK
ncbi:MAG: ParB/RepB/Spo0J family partition protein [Planctomycetales bacterium]|nr:ParB/RepB/Spo0J family partition protein [Planctomycetales bacterium]